MFILVARFNWQLKKAADILRSNLKCIHIIWETWNAPKVLLNAIEDHPHFAVFLLYGKAFSSPVNILYTQFWNTLIEFDVDAISGIFLKEPLVWKKKVHYSNKIWKPTRKPVTVNIFNLSTFRQSATLRSSNWKNTIHVRENCVLKRPPMIL